MTISPKQPLNRGIYLLPNLFTVGGLFAGFYAIVSATHQRFETAAIAIFVAMILDSLDGRIARLTHSESEFGAQMDSLSDMVCFGITPAFVLYMWSLNALGKPGWLVAFLYTVCTALRLARFNSQAQQTNKRYFQGLPTPAAAGLVAGLVWVASKYAVLGQVIVLPVAVVSVLVSLLKVSTIRYRSFKDLDLKGKVSFFTVLLIVLIFVLIAIDPSDALLVIFALYVASGPVTTLLHLRRWRSKKRIRKTKSHRDAK